MVRPSNLAPALAMFLIWLGGTLLHERRRLLLLPLVLGAFAAPFVPQAVNNYRINGRINPLVIHDVFAETRMVGMRYIKQATVHSPEHDAHLLHANPFLPPDLHRPGQFLRKKPLGYLATCLLHGLFLFDQDSPFTYVVKLRTWYRWPSSALSFAFLGLSLHGAGVVVRRALRRRRLDRLTFAAAAALVLSGSYLAVHLPSHVEARYGTPLYLLLGLFVALAVRRLAVLVRHARYVRLGAAATWIIAMVVLGCGLSAWLDGYALVRVLGS
jgi:hypothetical protein